VDYLLQRFVSSVDSNPVLRRLLNMQFVHRDAGRYAVQQVDRDYALGRIAEGTPEDRIVEAPPFTRFALRHFAAEWFRQSRKPRKDWKSLEDLSAEVCEFELRCQAEEFDAAAQLLTEFDLDYLFLWGHYRLMIDLHERLQGKIADPTCAQTSVGNL